MVDILKPTICTSSSLPQVDFNLASSDSLFDLLPKLITPYYPDNSSCDNSPFDTPLIIVIFLMTPFLLILIILLTILPFWIPPEPTRIIILDLSIITTIIIFLLASPLLLMTMKLFFPTMKTTINVYLTGSAVTPMPFILNI